MRDMITGAMNWHDDNAFRHELTALGKACMVVTVDAPGCARGTRCIEAG